MTEGRGGFGRRILLGLIKLFYRAAPKPAPAIDVRGVRKVLVVRTDTRVGNVLLTTPLVRALRRGLPGARIDFLVAAGKERLVEGLVDRLVVLAKKDFFRRPWRLLGFLLSLRRERYDVVIEAGHWHAFSFTSLWIVRFTRAPVRIGHARGLSERFLTHEVQKDPSVVREVASKLELLGPLGLGAAGEGLETTIDKGEREARLAAEVIALGGGAPVVALNPGARKADHRWAPEAFGALAKRLREECGAVPLVMWGPGEEEIADEVVATSGGAAQLAPSTDLAVLAAVFRRSALVVTNDTGPMHLAVATGAPVVAVLLAEDGARWSHLGRFEGVAVHGGAAESVERVFKVASRMLGLGPAGTSAAAN